MKLIGFRLQNIKSIVDTKWCHISDKDNITVFAGQNEAGKSAVLEGLNFFKNGANERFEKLSKRINTHPRVECEFILEDIDYDLSEDEDINAIVKNVKKVRYYRGNIEKDAYKSLHFTEETSVIVGSLIDDYCSKKNRTKFQPSPAPDGSEPSSDAEVTGQLDSVALKAAVEEYFVSCLPEFIYYDSFADILPASVRLNEIENYKAVVDFQSFFKINFSRLVDKNTLERTAAINKAVKEATLDLNSYWRQTQTTEDDDRYQYEVQLHKMPDPAVSEIEFMVHRNDEMPLYIEQKSKGFRWFSSFNLRLKSLGVSLENASDYVILIDEPGQGLHETAQADVKTVLQELADKGMQILYTTHNANLIGVNDSDILRIRLVYQNRKTGTSVKNIAQFSSQETGSKDALSPIITAMGISSVGQFLDRAVRCVVLEGITDQYYLNAMSKLLGITRVYSFIPAVGVHNVRPLISVLIGWGADYKVVFDDGEGKKVYKDISKYLFMDEKSRLDAQVMKLDGFDGIEDLFTKEDFDKYVSTIKRPDLALANSAFAKPQKKELLARLFLEKTVAGPENIQLSEKTKKNFQNIFDWLNM